jgi:predicted DNA-binding transcriptional regulator YafY
VIVDVTGRMLQLLSLLQTHRTWAGGELADRLQVSRRTLRRDIDRLRELGYAVRSSRGVDGGYQLQGGASLPPLLFDDQEAVAIAVGLRSAAAGTVAGIEEISVQALAKLEQVLPTRLRNRINAFTTYIVPVPDAGPGVSAEVLTAIVQACRDQERLRFGYRARDGVESDRRVEPLRLVSWGRRWYLVAWDLDREDWRTFRVDRMHGVTPTAWRFEARIFPAADVAAFVAAAVASAPSRFEAVVTLHAPLEEVSPQMGHMCDGSLERVDDATCTLRTGGDHLGWLAASITLLGVDFEVREPDELVDHIRGMSRRLADAVSG